ncbi:SCA7-domain-containing protein [Rhizophagus irregularis]|uniref:SCA7-domain-containing protein n=1 Tax=Rhizophagus irregularis TaxID=588596 RepID=A0A2N0NZ71_9GLOM|nr:SCA7-domain-containing protein [Rhizophagus irregularis]
MDASTSTESSNIKIPETIVTNKGLQDKRPNSPISAEESPRKKQKIKKSRKKKKIIRRNKGAIDLDVQCGVIAQPDNTPCVHSLNCKKHSLASKRNVVGRSQPYVILLIQYQKNKKSIGRHQDNGMSKSNDNDKKDDIEKEVCSADERKYLRPDRPDVPSPHVCDVDLFLNSICPTL